MIKDSPIPYRNHKIYIGYNEEAQKYYGEIASPLSMLVGDTGPQDTAEDAELVAELIIDDLEDGP